MVDRVEVVTPVEAVPSLSAISADATGASSSVLPFLWSFGDDLVATVAMFSLARTLFYTTRSRSGRPVRREAAAVFLKYWSAFWVLRLCFELWEDFVPVIVHVTGYQIVKIAVFVIITARSMWAGEKFYEDVVARAFEERKEEIEELGNQWANLVTPLQESLIDILEYLVGWLKRRYIMDGGKISLQPRQIVLDPAEAEAMNSRQRSLPALPMSSEDGVAFFTGGESLSRDKRMLQRRNRNPSSGHDTTEGFSSVSESRAGGGGEELTKRLPRNGTNQYDRIRSLRKQLQEGSFRKNKK